MATSEAGADPEFSPHRMTIDRYERMVDAGVYGDKSPIFLWNGSLVEPLPKSRPYSVASMSPICESWSSGAPISVNGPVAVADVAAPMESLPSVLRAVK